MEKSGKIRKSVIINILLFVGLIALYGLHFWGNYGDADEELVEPLHQPLIERKLDGAFVNIAYVDNDYLLDNYKLAISMSAEFEAEQQRLENDLDRRQRNFQVEVERFQRDIQRGHITMEEAQVLEQELLLQQQDLFQLGETYRERLARREFEMNSELLDSIRAFLDRYNETRGYDFILGYARGGGILYAGKQHDITAEVLQLLNEEHD